MADWRVVRLHRKPRAIPTESDPRFSAVSQICCVAKWSG